MPGGANISWIKYNIVPSPILDSVTGSDAAYSTRLLRTAYSGSAIRVRRSSDNTEQDIGFSGGELNTSSLLSFCGSGDGFVKTWYDQSGGARDATQATNANQPQIVSSGSLITQNSKPALRFSTSQYLDSGSSLFYDSIDYSFWVVYSKATASANDAIFINDGGTYLYLQYGSSFLAGDNTITGFSLSNNQAIYACAIRTATPTISAYKNGSLVGSVSDTNANETFRYIALNTFRASEITFSEIILYPSDKTSNRTTVDTNISQYYGI